MITPILSTVFLNNLLYLDWIKKTKQNKTKQNKTKQNKTTKQKQLDMLPSQTAYPAGFETSTPDWPQFAYLSRKCDASVWITWIYLVT